MATKKKTLVKEEKVLSWKILVLAIVTFVAYYPTMSHDFVDWDDIVYIMNNDMITSFSWINLQKIFSTSFMGNYDPFILLSFSFDYHFFRFVAAGYHVHNLLLHMVNAALVYAFVFHLLKKNSPVALAVALLFALHPMHVESVAWVSERKDVLYTAWYLLSLLAYLFYRQKERLSYYWVALLFFVFSNLSKGQAVTLPVVLLLVDYLSARKFDRKALLEKVPFFAIALLFGIVAIFAQRTINSINVMGMPVTSSLFYAPYSLCLYLVKFLVPYNLIAMYEYPLTASGSVPLYIYFSPLIFLGILAVVWKTWKTRRYIPFGLLFFLATILPVLQFLPVGGTVAAERYTYIPYIGLSVILAIAFFDYRLKTTLQNKKIMDAAGIVFLVILAVATWNRTLVWKDSVALWTDVIEKDPGCVHAYNNRAFIYHENKEFDKSLRDLTSAIKLDSNDKKRMFLYSFRASVYKKTGKYDSAIMDYTTAIKKNPAIYRPYFFRGIIYTDIMKNYRAGIDDFKTFLKQNPDDVNGNLNLGIAYYNNKNYDSAKTIFLKSLKLNPANGEVHWLLADIYNHDGDYESAYQHGIKAKQCGTAIDTALMYSLTEKQKKAQNKKLK